MYYGLLIHRASCRHQCSTTEEYYEVEKILDVFGHVHPRWFLVKWRGYAESEWERGHLLETDGRDSIRPFWEANNKVSNKNEVLPTRPQGRPLSDLHKVYQRTQELKTHKTWIRHHNRECQSITRTTIKDVVLQKRKSMYQELPKVKWGDQTAENC